MKSKMEFRILESAGWDWKSASTSVIRRGLSKVAEKREDGVAPRKPLDLKFEDSARLVLWVS